jgi:hypothetical protein
MITCYAYMLEKPEHKYVNQTIQILYHFSEVFIFSLFLIYIYKSFYFTCSYFQSETVIFYFQWF